MNKLKRVQCIFLYGVFICYVFFLIKLLFLSRISSEDLFNSSGNVERSINLIPFYSIKEYMFSNSASIRRFSFANVVGNIAIFIPLGTYLLLFRKNKKVISNLIMIFIVSLSVEIIQGILGIGSSDIDDIILNCLGGAAGILVYKFLFIVLRNEKNVRIAVTILSVLGLPILLYLLFFVRLRL